ncbi:UbiX family flavin prenyltransferase [bacterium endosymbiont of Pedicinus badii]|uniref:UbiX family flavin prenyltransferase n=1 Tax=bacterium endosymbiont of Pedicinus badii TaxID=1719126 RepID=UPI0009BB684F|nr:UbiX family flavin prenyltransferase [bacterium endosymbiont of Pedicinus badii]OQM34460.1 3-octaprenyl-4-hydroxybenzoate carboxy-lyase [bacterium endosymbiont of Pedicinus badii]
MKKIILAISGASGVIYGIRLLQILKLEKNIETHLIISESARKTISLETNFSIKSIEKLSDKVYDFQDISADISSGSFKTFGMFVVPCSIRTLSGIANSYNENLIIRAADVILKENRYLVLGIRETPIHIGHINLMHKACSIGAIIMPLVPSFYKKPKKIQEIVDNTVNRMIDQMGIVLQKEILQRWKKNNFIG